MSRKMMSLFLAGLVLFCASGCTDRKKADEQLTVKQTENAIQKEEKQTGYEKEETRAIEESDEAEEIVGVVEKVVDAEVMQDETAKSISIEKTEGMEVLKERLEAMVYGYEGDWAVYVSDLESKEYLEINNHAVKSASLIKLFIMGAVLEQVEEGNLADDETLEQLLYAMITVSDNESSNELVRRLSPDGTNHPEGMEVVNAFAQANGYDDTSQGRDMLDFREVPAEGENYTSVRDCGMFLESVYYGECISEEVSEKMLGLLKQQTRTWKIPAGVPEGVVTANKTGELSDTENDAAIVFSPGGDYILCVTATGVPDTETAVRNIVEISAAVYQYINEE